MQIFCESKSGAKSDGRSGIIENLHGSGFSHAVFHREREFAIDNLALSFRGKAARLDVGISFLLLSAYILPLKIKGAGLLRSFQGNVVQGNWYGLGK